MSDNSIDVSALQQFKTHVEESQRHFDSLVYELTQFYSLTEVCHAALCSLGSGESEPVSDVLRSTANDLWDFHEKQKAYLESLNQLLEKLEGEL